MPIIVIIGLSIIAIVWVVFIIAPRLMIIIANSFKGNKQPDINREKELSDWAKPKGLILHYENDYELFKRYCFVDCLQQGQDQYAYHVMEGTVGNRKVCAFDYHYEASANNNRIQHFESEKGACTLTYSNVTYKTSIPNSFSAVILETDLNLKPLFIRAENNLDKVRPHRQVSSDPIGIRALNKLSRSVSFNGIPLDTMMKESGLPDGKITDSPRSNDIDFESTEFNNQFHVSAHDRKWAYDVINQKNMDLLLNANHYNVEFNNNAIIAYRNDLFSPADFDAALNLINGMLDNLSESLIQELKGSGK
jgi:hypothetical protein